MGNTVAGKTIDQWIESKPVLENVSEGEKVFWLNDGQLPYAQAREQVSAEPERVKDASDRLKRFAPFIELVYPETKANNGLIESPITHIPHMTQAIEEASGQELSGTLYLKRDDSLPVAGSVKARGAVHEVLKFAEEKALEAGLLSGYDDDYRKFASDAFQDYMSQFKVQVGSTGNLAIATGVMSAALGFNATVHMSSDAKQWKKDYLRDHGNTIKEYDTDFTEAVAQGRKESDADPKSHFVDDEHSMDLFYGYAVAGERVAKQLAEMDIKVDSEHPLFVYIPCGVGGAPGGITYGFKEQFGDDVHVFFVEPTQIPAMALSLITEQYGQVSVTDFALSGQTGMDGLAVGTASRGVAEIMAKIVSGIYTVTDQDAYNYLSKLIDTEDIAIEPSSTPGMYGPQLLLHSAEGKAYLERHKLTDHMHNATHLAWATGGSMVPEEDMKAFYDLGC